MVLCIDAQTNWGGRMKIELNNFEPQFPHLSEETLKSFLRFLPVIWPGKHVLLCAHVNKDNYSGD